MTDILSALKAAQAPLILLGNYIGNEWPGGGGILPFDRCAAVLSVHNAIAALESGSPVPGTVFVLNLSTKHGDYCDTYTTREAAEAAKADYAVDNWSDIMDGEPPEDRADASAQYWHRQYERGEDQCANRPVRGWTPPQENPAPSQGNVAEPTADDAVKFIRVLGEELVNAGMPAGDRTVILANIRGLIAGANLASDRQLEILASIRELIIAAEAAGWDIGENAAVLNDGRDAYAALPAIARALRMALPLCGTDQLTWNTVAEAILALTGEDFRKPHVPPADYGLATHPK